MLSILTSCTSIGPKLAAEIDSQSENIMLVMLH